MPDLEVTIGGRPFQVSCQPGRAFPACSAAGMLDAEAAPIIAQMGRLPEAKMLLMAGLMLADKTAAVEDELRTLRARVAELEARPVATRDVAVIPQQVNETLAEIAARAEAMAARVEEQLHAWERCFSLSSCRRSPQREFTTSRYSCDRGVEVPATYINGADQSLVVIHVDGQQITLVNEPITSGARYGWPSDGSNYVWWTKGSEATLSWKTPEGEAPLLTCAIAP